jgi:hypothetical protein
MRSLLLAFLLFSTHSFSQNCGLSFKKVKKLALTQESVELKQVHFSFDDLNPYQYEVELAKRSNLEVEEIMGLTRNFHDDLISTGDTGVYRLGHELKYIPDSNLLKAYKYAMKSTEAGKITGDQLVQMRKHALELNYFKNGRNEVRVDFKFKGTEDNAYITDVLDESVVNKLKDFGHQVQFHPRHRLPDDLPDFIKLKNESAGVYIIKYPTSTRLENELHKIAKNINVLVEARAPPEYIASVAVQDILTLHPFADGNGRTARLYGQVIYKQLTGNTILFPKLFHKEMSHSVSDLAKSLFKNSDFPNPIKDKNAIKGFDSLMEHSVYNRGVSPEILAKDKALQHLEDLPFEKVVASNFFRIKRTYNYSSITDKAKLLDYEGDLFFGKGFNTMSEADGHIKSFFSKGRKRNSLENININEHVESTANYASSFIQTTKSPRLANHFAVGISKKEVGVVYIINSKNVDLLEVNPFIQSLGRRPVYEEQEVLLFGNLSPSRIKGAYIIDKANQQVQRFIVNPHYLP